MTSRLNCVCTALAFGMVSFAAAAQSWNGTWKLNEAKSKFTGDTFVIDSKGNGMMHFSDGAVSYDYACDGKPYTVLADRTVTCTGTATTGYDYVTKAADRVLYKSHHELSADGKSMTIHGTELRPDGSTQNYSNVYKRESGTSGLVGKWLNVKSQGAAGSMVIESKGNWIKMSFPEYKTTIEGNMDGSNIAVKGPDVPQDMWTMIKSDGANKLQYTDKYKDKVLDQGTMALSADGKTVVNEQWVPGKMSEKATAVYERQ